MPIRVCSNGHLTGQRTCTTCKSRESLPLGDRIKPVYQTKEQMKDLRQLRSRTRVVQGTDVKKISL